MSLAPAFRTPGPAPRLVVMTLGVVLFALVLNALLSYFNFEKTYSQLVTARYLVLAKDVRQSIEYGLNLGFSLAEMKNLRALVGEVASQNPAIRSVAVLDSRGEVLFSSQGSQVGPHSSVGGWPAAVEPKAQRIATMEEGANTVSVPITNPFGATVGRVVLSYYDSAKAEKMNALLVFLLGNVAMVMVLMVLVVSPGVYLMTRTGSANTSGAPWDRYGPVDAAVGTAQPLARSADRARQRPDAVPPEVAAAAVDRQGGEA